MLEPGGMCSTEIGTYSSPYPHPGMSDQVCPDCERPFGLGRRRTSTVTGREVCEDCAAKISGLAAGVIVNSDDPVTGAISTEGWYQRLRRRRKQRRES